MVLEKVRNSKNLQTGEREDEQTKKMRSALDVSVGE